MDLWGWFRLVQGWVRDQPRPKGCLEDLEVRHGTLREYFALTPLVSYHHTTGVSCHEVFGQHQKIKNKCSSFEHIPPIIQLDDGKVQHFNTRRLVDVIEV